jgi:catechol 2,3-dioxygenase-like lactoylglutathione lyase family enzyme
VRVEQVDFVAVPTRDMSRAVAFYQDVLGLPVSPHAAAEVETPNVTLSFWSPERDGEEFVPNVAGIAFRVADVGAAVEEVRAAGAEVIGIEDTGVCQMGFVKDPDGNTVILHRRYAPHAD